MGASAPVPGGPEGFEAVAAEWLAWARTEGHDDYWLFREAFFSIVPPPGSRTLEVGCGEGRVSRDLAARGHAVTAVDASPTLLRAAAAAHPEGEYVLARAERLPFPDAAFDLVVAHNVLMDVDDMPAAVAEAARVLAPGGRLCVAVTHPLADAGRWAGSAPDAPFVVHGSYLAAGELAVTVERDGLAMTFAGRTYPLEAYARALEAAGLVIECLREPAAPPVKHDAAHWSRIPQFLHLRAAHPPGAR
jgi:SAM-dependent methyltransferase